MPDPEQPPACLPGEEPIIDLDMFSEATRLLVAAATAEDNEDYLP